jgi:hypothetical protein
MVRDEVDVSEKGGKVRHRNRLWRPPEGEEVKQTVIKQPPTDEVCFHCPNRIVDFNGLRIPCQNICAPLQWVNGNVPLKEAQLRENIEPSSDYNEILAEQIEARRSNFTALIAEETNIRKKAVAVLLEAEFKIDEIARVMKVARRTILRMRK